MGSQSAYKPNNTVGFYTAINFTNMDALALY